MKVEAERLRQEREALWIQKHKEAALLVKSIKDRAVPAHPEIIAEEKELNTWRLMAFVRFWRVSGSFRFL